jgi:hypothetical protein
MVRGGGQWPERAISWNGSARADRPEQQRGLVYPPTDRQSDLRSWSHCWRCLPKRRPRWRTSARPRSKAPTYDGGGAGPGTGRPGQRRLPPAVPIPRVGARRALSRRVGRPTCWDWRSARRSPCATGCHVSNRCRNLRNPGGPSTTRSASASSAGGVSAERTATFNPPAPPDSSVAAANAGRSRDRRPRRPLLERRTRP